jgi:hypothetical protein
MHIGTSRHRYREYSALWRAVVAVITIYPYARLAKRYWRN